MSTSSSPSEPSPAQGDAPAAGPRERPGAVLLVLVGETWLGLDATAVEEVIALEPPSPLPFAPPHVLGVIVHGDRVLPLVHLGRLLELPMEAEGERRDHSFGRTIVLSARGMSMGVLCERAAGVEPLGEEQLEPVTLMQGQALAAFLVGECDTPRGRCGVLDVNALVEAARIKG